MLDSVRINESKAETPAAPTAEVKDGVAPESVTAGAKPPATEPEKPAEKPADKPADKPFVPKIEAPAEKPKAIDFTKALAEFGKDGKVSDETYKALEAAGVARSDVDTHLAGHKARVEGVVTKLSEIAGGQDNLKAVLEWAGANTDAKTRDAFNAAMERGDEAAASLMVRGLAAQYADSVGTEGERISGQATKGGVEPFQSWEQVRAAMSDKRYANDPAYQKSVERRMAVSNF